MKLSSSIANALVGMNCKLAVQGMSLASGCNESLLKCPRSESEKWLYTASGESLPSLSLQTLK